MSDLQILVLAVVQGLTEFLPISSSAHLILSPYLFGFDDQGLAFDVAVRLDLEHPSRVVGDHSSRTGLDLVRTRNAKWLLVTSA